jgi:hypothetical protein
MDAPLHFTLTGLSEALNELSKAASGSEGVMGRTLFRIATLGRDTAVKYAPRSPTLADLRKATGRKFAIRKKRGTSRPKPGGLERSIEFTSDASDAVVFVASNSEAGKYAFAIHEEKGSSWRERGIGTVSKGANADEKFITRALSDRAADFFKIIQDAQGKVLGK